MYDLNVPSERYDAEITKLKQNLSQLEENKEFVSIEEFAYCKKEMRPWPLFNIYYDDDEYLLLPLITIIIIINNKVFI